MYLVTIINDNVEKIINEVSTNTVNRISGTVKQGINTIDSFTFNILPNNQGYNLIFPLKTKVKVLNTKTNKYEFIGRVLTPSGSMSSDGLISKTYICESELAYLLDSMQKYEEVHNISVKDYLNKLLSVHNNKVSVDKQFKLGIVTVVDNNDSLYKNIAYDSTKKNIENDLIDTLGGELQIRYEGNEKYLDYLTEIGKTCTTEIRLGKNIIDITNEIDPTKYITRLYPLGAKLKTKDSEGNDVDSEERLNIASVNNGLEYIDDVQGIEEFGIIEGFEFWDDVTEASNLLKKGQSYLSAQRIAISNKINALDLSLIELDIDSFEVGNYYPLKHELLDIDYNVRIIEKSISIDSPENTSITLGDKQKDIKEYQLEMKKQYEKVKKENEQLKNNINKIYDYATEEINRVDTVITETNTKIDGVNSEIENIKNQINSSENYIFDIGSKTLSSVKEDLTLTTTTVMQSFDIDLDNNCYYFVQRITSTTSDLIVSKVNSSGKTVGTMTLNNFGHGSNMEVEVIGSDAYIWIESDSVLDSENVGHGTKISRIKFENGATYTNTGGNTFDLLPGHTFFSPSIDKINNKLCIRSYYNNARYFTVFKLNSVMSNNPVKLTQFEIVGAMEDYPLQGHEIHGNYIYLYEGVGATDTTSSMAYITVFDFKGNIKYRSQVNGFETLDFREPEGIKLKKISSNEYELYIGFASGVKGSRKANIYKFTDTYTEINDDTYYNSISVKKYRDSKSNTTYFITYIPHEDEEGNRIILRNGVSNYYENGETDDLKITINGTSIYDHETNEFAVDFSIRKNATICTNAGVWNVINGNLKKVGNYIVDGKVINSDTSLSNKYTLCIKDDGTLVDYPNSISAESLLEKGIKNALTGFIPIIHDGSTVKDSIKNLYARWNESHPRQVIAQKSNKDLVILTCNGRLTNEAGMTIDECINILKTYKVNYAYLLDGGGSTSLVYKHNFFNQQTDNNGLNQRPCFSFLYCSKIDNKNFNNDIKSTNIMLGEIRELIKPLYL